MTSEQLRLDCLKLAQQAGGSPGSTVERAKVYEKYVAGEPAKDAGPFTSEPEKAKA